MKALFRPLALIFVAMFFATGCATYQSDVHGARLKIENKQFGLAVEELAPLAEKVSDDQLIYLLDYAVTLQLAGETKKSTKAFLKADKLIDQMDYHSVSRVAGSMALGEEMVQYKGDTFERMFVNAYLAMNFLAQGDLESALVEARRINEKYQKNRLDKKDASYEQNFFSKFLSALIWEAEGKYDDAYIDYEICYKIDPAPKVLHEALIRTAKQARRQEAYNRWKGLFPEISESPQWYDKKLGELVVIYQQGWGPRKAPDPASPRFPILKAHRAETQSAQLVMSGLEGGVVRVEVASPIYDVETAAIQTLQADAAALAARRLGGLATKAVIADQIRQKNEGLGDLAWLIMNVADRADLRQWSTLPQSIQLIRLPLKAGSYTFRLNGLSQGGFPTGESQDFQIQIRSGKKSFIIWRSVR